MRALNTAATGMMAQELNVQVISNNIANMRTTAYKRQRAEFQDLLYDHVRRIGSQTTDQGNILPVGVDLGSGVKTVGTPRIMTQGTPTLTDRDLDETEHGGSFVDVVFVEIVENEVADGLGVGLLLVVPALEIGVVVVVVAILHGWPPFCHGEGRRRVRRRRRESAAGRSAPCPKGNRSRCPGRLR